MTPLEIPFSTARQLFDCVSPLNTMWDTGRYIFRGQPDATYKLTPSVCRRGAGSFAYGSARRTFDTSSNGQVSFELDILKKFLDGCDKSGLIVPGYTEHLKNKFHNEINSFMSAHIPWPPASLYEIMAVAQHYDVPTRLLDWTERALVACYFAASSANLEVDTNMPRIAIWALDTSQAKHWETVKVIRTPGGTSKNQAAQSGLFTTHNVKDYSFTDSYQVEALEEVQEIYYKTGAYHPLIKVTMPVSEAPDLLNLCARFGVDGSTLFPGFHGVAKSVKDWANVEVGVRMSQSARDDANADSYDPDFY
ncbi:FRG domain-containing protein [Pseudomonas sp. NFACC05-1]|uniref:FRG domain-containing protein n=1 Tax=Pseudomonas sp. NFACC05-1 TaxID=1566241 RepID=UPI000871A06D|nr:FRG domain-containing protein [Pseudomonas sp. NFACC05-1]SCW76176.1 FRG domain-containing protein [Pseudomonas sp. NFACC05-1]